MNAVPGSEPPVVSLGMLNFRQQRGFPDGTGTDLRVAATTIQPVMLQLSSPVVLVSLAAWFHCRLVRRTCIL